MTLNHAQEFVLVTPTHTQTHTLQWWQIRAAVTDSDSQVMVESSIDLVKDGRMFGSEWEASCEWTVIWKSENMCCQCNVLFHNQVMHFCGRPCNFCNGLIKLSCILYCVRSCCLAGWYGACLQRPASPSRQRELKWVMLCWAGLVCSYHQQ